MNKELSLLNQISQNNELSQRELAKQIDVSLGTVNNMIQTFEKDNIISVRKLSPRKVYYSLTAKGRAYQNELYVEHISSCFDTIAFVRKTFKQNINQLVDEGKSVFYIQGQTDELVRLAKMCFFELSRKHSIKYSLLDDLENKDELFESIQDEDKSSYAIVGWSTKPETDYKFLTYMNLLS